MAKQFSITRLLVGGFVAILSVAVLLLILPFIMNLFVTEPEVDDSDLMSVYSPVKDRDNAYFDLIEIEELSDIDSEILHRQLKPNTWWESGSVRVVLERNQSVLARVAAASRKFGFEIPNTGDPSSAIDFLRLSQEVFNKVDDALSLNLLKAKQLSKQNKNSEAVGTLMDSLRLAMILRGPDITLINRMVAGGLLMRALKVAQSIIKDTHLSLEELGSYLRAISSAYSSDKDIRAVLRTEYRLFKKMAVQQLNESQMPAFYRKQKHTEFLLAEFTRKKLKEDLTGCEHQWQPYQRLSSDSRIVQQFTTNSLGKEIVDGFAIFVGNSIDQILKDNCHSDFLVSSILAMIGIKAYKLETGEMPESLDDLVPNYLQSVPIDPYSKQKIAYSKSKKEIKCMNPEAPDWCVIDLSELK